MTILLGSEGCIILSGYKYFIEMTGLAFASGKCRESVQSGITVIVFDALWDRIGMGNVGWTV